VTAAENVRGAYARIAADGRSGVWIALRPERDAQADAHVIDHRAGAGEELPLAGLTLAVKDNIDVAGMDTTAACPSFAYHAGADAEVVSRLKAAGAIVLGKTNMDQFATGLVGTRSPYGAVQDASRTEYVSGGSSSGSAVAVALSQVDLALATDTAGSGRVPAAFQGIFGIKPTRGLVPTLGVVPACPTLDCVSLFARTLELAQSAAALIWGPHADDPMTRAWPLDAPLGAPPAPLVAVPWPRQLVDLSRPAQRKFAEAISRLQETGADVVEIDLAPFLEAGLLLYNGALVAERYAAVGRFLEGHPDDVDPHVAAIIVAAESVPAHELVSDRERLDELRRAAFDAIAGAHALMLPTTTSQPTIAEVLADPVAINSRLGTYTNFCNLFEMCALAMPAGDADGGHFGVTLYAPAFHDLVLTDIAARMTATSLVASPSGPPTVELFVSGEHLAGQPLNSQLTDRGGRLLREVRTAPRYSLFALPSTPEKPALRRVDPDDPGGESIVGELWMLPLAGIGSLLADLPAPMALGRVELIDGSEPIGVLYEQSAHAVAPEISAHGSWRA
jgi:allophanate hydrolase